MNIYIALFVIYLVAMLVIGYFGSKKVTSSYSYATSAGDVTPFSAAITFAATFASAGTFLGVAGQGFAFGMTNIWFWASQWTTCCIMLLIVVKPYRKLNLNMKSATVADWVADRYQSQGLRIYLAVISLLQILFIASQLVGAGIVINQMIPAISYQMAVLISAVVIIVYISMGGTYAHIYTNVVQGTMMCVLAVVIAASGFFLFGNIFTEVPARLAAIDPHLAAGLNPNNGGYPTVISVIGLFVAHLWWTLNPQLINKATYLKNDREIKKFIILVAVFMFLMSSVVLGGHYARLFIPEGVGGIIPTMDSAIPWLVGAIFPKVISAIFLVVIMAAMMSTVDGVLLYVASIFGGTMYREIFIRSKRDRGEVIDEAKVEKTALNIMKYSTIFIGLIAAPIAFSKPANLTALLWTAAGPILASLAGPILLGIFSKRTSAKAAALGSVGGCLCFLIIFFGSLVPGVYLCCAVGGLVSVLLTLLGTYIFEPMDQKFVAQLFGDSEVAN